MSKIAAHGGASSDPIACLIAAQPQGRALLQKFYTDPAIFERDIERVHMRHWLCIGHESRVPDPGDYVVFDVARESVIVIRGRMVSFEP